MAGRVTWWWRPSARWGRSWPGVTEGLQEIGTTPSDFVQLDPEVEGMASEANVVVAVTRTPKSTAGPRQRRAEAAALGAG